MNQRISWDLHMAAYFLSYMYFCIVCYTLDYRFLNDSFSGIIVVMNIATQI